MPPDRLVLLMHKRSYGLKKFPRGLVTVAFAGCLMSRLNNHPLHEVWVGLDWKWWMWWYVEEITLTVNNFFNGHCTKFSEQWKWASQCSHSYTNMNSWTPGMTNHRSKFLIGQQHCHASGEEGYCNEHPKILPCQYLEDEGHENPPKKALIFLIPD